MLLYICFGLSAVFNLIMEFKKNTEKPVFDSS